MRANNPAMPMFPWLYRLVRFGLASIFIYSGVTKLSAPNTFAVLIDAYGLVPEVLLMPMAVTISMLEILAGIGLLVDLRGSLSVISGLLLLFVAILGFGIWMGLDIDCGCFGPEDPEAKAFHGLSAALYRDIAMLAAVVFMYWWRSYHQLKPIRLSVLTGKRLLNRTEDAHV